MQNGMMLRPLARRASRFPQAQRPRCGILLKRAKASFRQSPVLGSGSAGGAFGDEELGRRVEYEGVGARLACLISMATGCATRAGAGCDAGATTTGAGFSKKELVP